MADEEILRRYSRIADGFTRRLESVKPEAWMVPSPCTEWAARDVAVHVINTHRRVLSALDDGKPRQIGPDDDVVQQWPSARSDVEDSLRDPEKATKTVGGMFGEQPFESLVGRLLCTDTLLHTWDLARATGLDEELDAEAVDRAAEFLTPIDEAIRRPGGFAPKIEPAPGADKQTRFLNFCGRSV